MCIPMAKRSRKRAAWGALTQVDASTWRIRYWSSGPDGYRRRSKTVRGTRKDAERVRAELMLAHGEDAPCLTVGEAWERWYEPDLVRAVDEGEASPQTLAQYRSAWRNHVAPTWADVPCDSVRPLAVQQWITSLGHSQAVAGKALFQRVMDYAVRYECVVSNPLRERYVMPPKSTVRRRDEGVWTLDELGEVWRAVHGQWFEAAFLLAAFGGLRVGEAMGVTAADVRAVVARGQPVTLVRVARQVANRGEVTETLKNEQSRRVVAIPGRAGARLLALAGSCDGYLSGDGMGGHSTQRRMAAQWEREVLPSLRPELRHPFKNLRNSWQTNCRWSLGLPPWLIEPMMGHVGEGVTGRHYDRPQADMFADAMADAYAAHTFDAGWTWAT